MTQILWIISFNGISYPKNFLKVHQCVLIEMINGTTMWPSASGRTYFRSRKHFPKQSLHFPLLPICNCKHMQISYSVSKKLYDLSSRKVSCYNHTQGHISYSKNWCLICYKNNFNTNGVNLQYLILHEISGSYDWLCICRPPVLRSRNDGDFTAFGVGSALILQIYEKRHVCNT